MVDGNTVLPMATSQDHKRALDGDTGPNTGGMGAYSPAPVVTREVHERIMPGSSSPRCEAWPRKAIPTPAFSMRLMIDAEGNPKVIEYNCRFGDPETQPIMMRLTSDFAELCLAGARGKLDGLSCDWDARDAVAW